MMKNRFLVLAIILLVQGACASLEKADSLRRAGDYQGETSQLTRLINCADGGKELPSLLLRRGMSYVDSAQKLRIEKAASPVMGGVFAWPPDAEEYSDYYSLARQDFTEVLDGFPDAPEAPEAQFMLGLINDHPHLNDFERAVVMYRVTLERYPGTPAAEKAGERLQIIEEIRGGVRNSPHGQ